MSYLRKNIMRPNAMRHIKAHGIDHFAAVRCECTDSGCPCQGRCHRLAKRTLYRVDMFDEDGSKMCRRCSRDAMESGVFTTNQSGAGCCTWEDME